MINLLDNIEIRERMDEHGNKIITTSLKFQTQVRIDPSIVNSTHENYIIENQKKVLAHYLSSTFYGDLYEKLCRLHSMTMRGMALFDERVDNGFKDIIDRVKMMKVDNDE